MIRRFVRDERGATIIEFAMVAPVMLTLILGLAELMFTIYAQSILDGAIQKAGRDSAIQGGADRAGEIDARVQDQIRPILKDATFATTRRSYNNFSSVKPERFTDGNGNGRRDAGECFDDINGNGHWDVDPGFANQGGASDVTKYTVEVTYQRLFPVAKLLGWGSTVKMTGETLFKNQPYARQASQTVASVCT